MLLLLIGLAAHACAAPVALPNLILITIDTVRADRMGFLGSPLGLTPNLDILARQSVTFSRAYCQVPFTYPSHATILTGTYPQFHHVNNFGVPLAKDIPSLPDILRQRGYQTAAFVGSVVLDPKAGWVPGIARGFDTYDADFGASAEDPRTQNLERPAAEVVARAEAWLKSHSTRPFFLWLHLYDPHAPYTPPAPFSERYASNPYNGEIAYTDSVLGKFFEDLRTRHLYDNALIAVMSDHGEAFGEHGERYHGIFLYDETIRVPLLLRMPAQRFAGTRIEVRAQLVDVAPTILEVAGIPIPKVVQGNSLLATIRSANDQSVAGKATIDRPAYAETDFPHLNYGWSSLRSLRTDKYLFIEAPRKELYDQSADPAAERNLAPASSAVAQTLNDQLEAFRQKTASSGKAEAMKMDPRLSQQLAALGYVNGNRPPEAPGKELSGDDPKDKIEIASSIDEALLEQGEGHIEKAIRILELAITKDPNVAALTRTLGSAWIQLQNYEKALPALRKTVELGDETTMDDFRLGQALFHTGDSEGAALQLRAAIAKSSASDPRYNAALHTFLARIYEEAGQTENAVNELQIAIHLDSTVYDSTFMLGRVLAEQGRLAGSVSYLQKASKLRPTAPDPHLLLAEIFAKLGRETEATVEHLEGERLKNLVQH